MTLKEYAYQLAEEAKRKPTEATSANIANKILRARVDDAPISETQINILLSYMAEYLGDTMLLCEAYENTAAVSLMAQVRKLVAQSRTGRQEGGKKQ